MPPHHVVPQALRSRPFTTEQARAAGVRRTALEEPRYHRLLQGVWCEAGLEVTWLVRARAAALVLPEGAAVSGRWAAQLWGCDVLPLGLEVVTAVVPPPLVPGRTVGLATRSAPLGEAHVKRRHEVPCTSLARTAADVARLERDRVEAVVTLDALRRRQDDVHVLAAALLEGTPGARHLRRAWERLAECCAGSESPMETRVRLGLADAGLPTPVLQHPVVVQGKRYRLDLAWPELCVALEYDGTVHDTREAYASDTARLTALTAAGWIVLRIRAEDWWGDRSAIWAMVAQTLATASRAR